MPFINSKVSVEITKQQQQQLKEQLGEAICAIRGKSESWLMLNFEDNQRMYFRGSDSEPIAFIDVKIYGRDDIQKLCDGAGLQMESFEKRGFCRLHCVVRKTG